MLRSGVGVTVVLTESCQYVLDVCIRLQKKNVSWEEKICNSTSIAGRVEFNGTAFVVLGWQLLECCYCKTSGTAPTDNQQVVCLTDGYCALSCTFSSFDGSIPVLLLLCCNTQFLKIVVHSV